MKTLYQHIMIGWAAFLILMTTLAGGFLNGPTVGKDTYSAPYVDVSSQMITGSYNGQPISEQTGRSMVPQWHSAQW